MDAKLIAALACGTALLLGACSGNNSSGTTGGGGNQPSTVSGTDGGNGGSNGGNGGAAQTPLQTAETRLSDARRDAMQAVETARLAVAGTEAARANAETLIAAASRALAEAVKAADAAVEAAAGGSAADVGAAARVRTAAVELQSQQTDLLDAARDSLAWYGRNLVRYQLANGEAVMPRERVNTATVVRIDRTIPTSNTDSTPKVNPEAFCQKSLSPATCEEDTFKTVMYEDGNRVFSVVDDGEGGDEFKVDGYVNILASIYLLDLRTLTGLKLTDGGLVIRTGGTANMGTSDDNTDFRQVADFTDMRKDITRYVSDTTDDGFVTPYDTDGGGRDSHSDGIRGQNGWDLAITFDEPQTRSVPVDFDDISNPVSSWTGNNAFYWKAIAPADPRQLDEDGDYYERDAFNQPKGYRDLGTYEVWLSNQFGLDRNREPAPGRTATCPDGSIGTSCPNDDEHQYLKYAAYGLFAYTASTETFVDTSRFSGRASRINTLHFGYSAFGTETGQKTEDIGQAITGGKFHGYTLAYEFSGSNSTAPNSVETKLLRGDVTLTVNIPKESGRRGTVEGTLNNFQQWNGENKYWTAYDVNNFTVALNSAAIGESGAFRGTTQATPSTGLNTRVTPSQAAGAGEYKGNFYGPRADAKDLEIAGSWTVGTAAGSLGNSASLKTILGSFGAKQKPPATPASD